MTDTKKSAAKKGAKRIAIYPGSFDPLTNGHVDVIERALEIFDEVIVAVLHNPSKKSLFTSEERVAMIKDSMNGFKPVQVDTFDGLLVEYARMKNAVAVIREIGRAHV